MKKTIKFIAVLLVVLSLFGCGKKEEELTVDNCENFFDTFKIEATIDKSGGTYKGGSNSLIFDYKIEGRKAYKFNDVVLTIQLTYNYDSVQHSNQSATLKPFDIELDENGNYYENYKGTYIPKNNEYLNYLSFDIDYEIVGVSGTVSAR